MSLEIQDIELPNAQPGHVLVDMAYSSVNPVDLYISRGLVAPDGPLPRTLGTEGSGTFDSKPVVIRGFGLGTETDGLWATSAVVPRESLIFVPDGVSLLNASAMGVAGLTAWRTVTEFAEVSPDDRVMVLGASGGVGSIIITIAHRLGATVWGQTTNPANIGWLENLGCERVVVGAADQLTALVSDLSPTVVFDPLGGDFTGASITALEPGGRLVIFGTSSGTEGTVPLQALYRKRIKVIGYGGLGESPDVMRDQLVNSLDALASGQLEVTIGEVVPLGDVNRAALLLQQRQVRGKLILDLGASS
jgi:NADPH2:quinone reductase